MEVDDPQAATEDEDGNNSNIEVLACFREVPPYKPRPIGGSFMTTESDNDSDENSLPEVKYKYTFILLQVFITFF